jgi:hypothetical protein
MQSVADFFALPDASALGWAHRIDTPTKLAEALADPAVHVIEADVHFGAGDATPLVGEAAEGAELDVTTVAMAALQAGKGLKFDFHSAAAVEPTLAVLRRLNPETPLILHADVFMLLSATNPAEAMEPDQFIRACQRACPRAVLSIGWSLKRPHDADGRVEDALIQQVASMVMQNLGPVEYGIEIRAGYTPGRYGARAEHGAAMLFDPLPPVPPPAYNRATNVVDILPRLRQVA